MSLTLDQGFSSEVMPVVVRLSRRDLIEFNLAITPRLRSTWVSMAVVAVLVGTVHALVRGLPTSGHEAIALAVGMVVAAALFLVLGFTTSLSFVLLASSATNGVLGEHTYVFETGGLRERTSANDTLIKWGGAQSVRRVGGYIAIQVAPALFHLVPRRCFGSAAEFDEFWRKAQRLTDGRWLP